MEIAFGKIDRKALRGKRGREAIELTHRELKLLSVLFRERGNAVSRESLLNQVWGVDHYGTTRTFEQLIANLRQKIEEVPGEPRHLLTVPYARLSAGGLILQVAAVYKPPSTRCARPSPARRDWRATLASLLRLLA